MADEIRTDTPGLARRVAQFEVEDVYVHLVYDPRLRFYIPKRWWSSERFDANVHAEPMKPGPGVMPPHLEIDVGHRTISIFRPGRDHIGPTSLALLIECLEFARQVFIEA